MRAEYARVYYSVETDPKFVTVYGNNHRFAWWVRLLLKAEQAWPNPPRIPEGMERSVLAHLVSVGLVDVLPHRTYTIHGLSAERLKRSEAGRVGGVASRRANLGSKDGQRTVNGRFTGRGPDVFEGEPPDGPLDVRRGSTSTSTRSNTRSIQPTELEERALYGFPHVTNEVARLCEELTGRSFLTLNGKAAGEFDRLCEVHGEAQVCLALRDTAKRIPHQPDWVQLVYGSKKVLEVIPDAPPKPQELTPQERARLREERREREARDAQAR